MYAHKGRSKKLKRHGLHKHGSWTYATKQLLFLPSEGAISDCFQPFPLGHLWTFKKKLRCTDFFFLMRVGQVLAWSCFRPFPTVSPLSLSIYTHIHHIQYIIIYCIYIIIYMYMYIFNSAYMYVHVHTHTLKTTMWLAFVHRWLLLAACAEKPHVLSKDRWPDKGLRFQGPVSPLILIGFPSYEWNHLSTCGNGISLLGVP